MFICGKLFNFLILFILNSTIQGWRLKLESFRQEHNADIVKFVNIHIINITNQQTALDGSFMFRKQVAKFDVNFLITSVKRNGLPWTLLNVTLDGCDYLKKGSRRNVNFPYIFLTEIRATNPDFPNKCPVEKEKVIFFSKFTMTPNRISLNFPEISFHCEVKLSQPNAHIFTFFVNGSVKYQ